MRKKRLRVLILLTIILFISIGFAVLSTNLSINGLFNFTSNTWSIVLKNVVVDDTSVTKTAPSINQDEDTITFSAELNKPGDYYSFNVDVENNSTLDAMLGSITTTGITSQYSDYLSCVVTYSNGVTPNTNDILYKTARVTFNIKLLYKDINTNQIPENTLNPTLQITINYKQANNDAVFVADTNHWNFDFTGSAQTFTAPKSANYKIELWGASGSGTREPSKGESLGGNGSYTKGLINLNKSESIYTYVGKGGEEITLSNFNNLDLYAVSFNGGGSGAFDTHEGGTAGEHGFAGGGATDIRTINGNWDAFNSLKSRLMVAGAGAGGGWSGNGSQDQYYIGGGGYAGGLAAPSAPNKETTLGGTQISGNKFGIGGNAEFSDGVNNNVKAAGGGGYFGGNKGITFAKQNSSGAGGSSFISGHAGCVAIDESSTEDNITFKTDTNEVACNSNTSTTYNSLGYNTDPKCSIHYSTKVFTDTIMIDGAGYSWTTVKANTPTGMPNKNGIGTVMGNTGNGYAKITLMS